MGTAIKVADGLNLPHRETAVHVLVSRAEVILQIGGGIEGAAMRITHHTILYAVEHIAFLENSSLQKTDFGQAIQTAVAIRIERERAGKAIRVSSL